MQGVPWRKLGEKIFSSFYDKNVYSKLDEIERQNQSNDDHLHAVIECWLQGDGEPSWRRLIWRLDSDDETRAVADNIRHFAEPLLGKSCYFVTFLCNV